MKKLYLIISLFYTRAFKDIDATKYLKILIHFF